MEKIRIQDDLYTHLNQAKLEELWGDKLSCFRPAPRIIDVQAKGVSKALAVKNLQKKLLM